MLYAPYDQMFQMNPGSGDWTGHKMWTNSLLLVFINTAQFFPLIWPCAPFSFTCLWCPSAAFIAFICPWGQTEGSQSAPSVVRWEGNRSIYLVYLRMFAWGVYSMCVARTGRCARAHSECLCHGFRFLWVIFVEFVFPVMFCMFVLSLSLSLSSVGVCPVLIGFTCILFIFFPLVSVCLFVSVSFSLWRVPAFFFSCSHFILHCGSIRTHLHSTTHWWRRIKQLESQIYPLGVDGDQIRVGTRVNIEQLFTVWTAEGETLVLNDVSTRKSSAV